MNVVMRGVSIKAGRPPGDATYIGERNAEPTRVSVLAYNAEKLESLEDLDAEACRELAQRDDVVVWFNVVGLADVPRLAALSKVFGLHDVMLEDILNTGQRPHVEETGDGLFTIAKMLYRPDGRPDGIVAEQISLLLRRNVVVSFQEVAGDVFGPIRERIKAGNGVVRTLGADYLFYALMDAIVDGYFVVLEYLAEGIDEKQEDVLERPTPQTLQQLHRMRRELIFLRKNVVPMRDAIGAIERMAGERVGEELRPYLRDLQDHSMHVVDMLDSLRDMLMSLLDVYLTSVSNRMNDIMRVLTVIATIFMPLSFVAGVYGMNFRFMPELQWRFAYPLVLGIMLGIGLVMLSFFRKRGWL